MSSSSYYDYTYESLAKDEKESPPIPSNESSDAKQLSESERVCTICMNGDSFLYFGKRLYKKPCDCLTSWIHKDCLEEWRNHQDDDTKCEVCKAPYKTTMVTDVDYYECCRTMIRLLFLFLIGPLISIYNAGSPMIIIMIGNGFSYHDMPEAAWWMGMCACCLSAGHQFMIVAFRCVEILFENDDDHLCPTFIVLPSFMSGFILTVIAVISQLIGAAIYRQKMVFDWKSFGIGLAVEASIALFITCCVLTLICCRHSLKNSRRRSSRTSYV